MSNIVKIKVIYDKNHYHKRRTCFWDTEEYDTLAKKEGYDFNFISIADYLDEKPIDDYLKLHKSYHIFLLEKYKDLKENHPDFLETKKKDYNEKNSSCPFPMNENSLTPLFLWDFFGKTLDPLFLLSLFERKKRILL